MEGLDATLLVQRERPVPRLPALLDRAEEQPGAELCMMLSVLDERARRQAERRREKLAFAPCVRRREPLRMN